MSKYESDKSGDYILIDRKEFETALKNIGQKQQEIGKTIQELEGLTGTSISVEKIMGAFQEELKKHPELSIDENPNSRSSAKMVNISEDGKRIGAAVVSEKKDAERAQRIEGKYTKVDVAQDAVRKALGEVLEIKEIPEELTKKLATQISELNDIMNVATMDTVSLAKPEPEPEPDKDKDKDDPKPEVVSPMSKAPKSESVSQKQEETKTKTESDKQNEKRNKARKMIV